MVPNCFHVISLGYNELNDQKRLLVDKCIESIYKYHPNHQVKIWNESNISDEISKIKENYKYLMYYFIKWYKEKKYAFCSDILRLFILRNYAGIYVDTDVEFIKPIPNSFYKTSFFCIEKCTNRVGVGLIWGVNDRDYIIKPIIENFDLFLSKYGEEYGNTKNHLPIIFNTMLNDYLVQHYKFENEDKLQYFHRLTIYPSEYFCPINWWTKVKTITENTISIHHYNESWR